MILSGKKDVALLPVAREPNTSMSFPTTWNALTSSFYCRSTHLCKNRIVATGAISRSRKSRLGLRTGQSNVIFLVPTVDAANVGTARCYTIRVKREMSSAGSDCGIQRMDSNRQRKSSHESEEMCLIVPVAASRIPITVQFFGASYVIAARHVSSRSQRQLLHQLHAAGELLARLQP